LASSVIVGAKGLGACDVTSLEKASRYSFEERPKRNEDFAAEDKAVQDVERRYKNQKGNQGPHDAVRLLGADL
jgi:hypothetical protein